MALLAYALALAAARSRVVVRGPSMRPTLWPGDRLWTLPLLGDRCRRRLLRPGRLCVVADPADPDHLVVKRLERWVDGRIVVLGDDPAASTDSRAWGSLPPGAARRIVVGRPRRPPREPRP